MVGLAEPRSVRGCVDVGRRRAELDPAGPCLLGLRHPDLEDAVLVGRGDLRVVDAGGEPDGARERAVTSLEAVETLALLLRLPTPLAGDGQRVVRNLDRDLALRQPGQIERIYEVGVGLPHVERGDPPLRTAVAAFEEPVEQSAHLGLHLRDLAKRLPTYECRHVSSFLRRCSNYHEYIICFDR